MRIKKKVTETVEKKVAALLREDPGYSASFIKRETEKALKKEGKPYNFTARTYSTIKKRVLGNIHIDDPLDEQWSIGDCDKYNIPDDMIPIIMEKRKVLKKIFEKVASSEPCDPHDDGGWLEIEMPPMTIRVARWMSRLKPSVDILIEKHKNDDVDSSGIIDNDDPSQIIKEKESFFYWLLYNIAQMYAYLEKISELLGHKRFDSSEADQLFFLKDYKNYGELEVELEMADLTLPIKLRNKTNHDDTEDERAEQQEHIEKDGEANG
jgi:hypothetical protein